jgi:serine/threonine-protein kinase
VPTTLVELRLLATPDVRIEGRNTPAVPAQPKRLALLAYLAAAVPYGFHRRDTLLALLWPESDQEHARTALRKAVHFLRQELGREVVASRGDEELGLAATRVWCDVREFAARLDQGALTEALSLYQGDLLPGLFVSEAPEFERWLEEERAGLRARAAEAAWTLAGRLERDENVEEAARWGRWAWARAPDDERGVRRLIGLLARLGDRIGALRVYEEFADRLARDYEAAPSTETRQLVDAVRAGVADNGALAASPLASVVSPPKHVGNAHQQHAPCTSPRQYIAIFPFRVHGDGSAAYLEDGLVDLLSTNLDHAGDLHSIDPHALLSLVAREGRARLDPASAGELAGRFGAELYVLGSVVGVAGQLRGAASRLEWPVDSARGRDDELASRPQGIPGGGEGAARGVLQGGRGGLPGSRRSGS